MNRFVFADANKCIGCRTCEVACAISHQAQDSGTLDYNIKFTPRLQMVKNLDVSTPVMCRQCDDAPCAKVCPNDAIIHADGHIKVIQSRCIGCKTCAIACPYGAMTVVTEMVENKTQTGLFKRPEARSQALKCDLCTHQAHGPECVRVCPTGAISIIDPEKLSQSSQNKRETAALSALDLKF